MTTPRTEAWVAGPTSRDFEDFRIQYQPLLGREVSEIAVDLATRIDHWLCGPADVGDEAQEWFLARAVERAAQFIADQPCGCTVPEDELCERCWAIGCAPGEHRTPSCLGADCSCGGCGWTEDENWEPPYPELWKGERSPGNGLIPCGFCQEGNWDRDYPANWEAHKRSLAEQRVPAGERSRPGPAPQHGTEGSPT